jgi:hypothetical protein
VTAVALRPRARTAALAVAVTGAALAWTGCGGGSAPPPTRVPDVRGLEVGRAVERVCDAGLLPRLAITRVLVPLYPAQPPAAPRTSPPAATLGPGRGQTSSAPARIRVTGTHPAVGTSVEAGSVVRLAIRLPGNVALSVRTRCP